MSNIDKFLGICGNCAGLDVNAITDEDVRAHAIEWSHSDEETPSEEDIEDAIQGLHELQDESRKCETI